MRNLIGTAPTTEVAAHDTDPETGYPIIGVAIRPF
jgi:hypothetical protein